MVAVMRRIAEAAGAMVWAASMAGTAWLGWRALQAAHAQACALPATAFEVGKQMLCGGDARDLVLVMLVAVSPLLVPLFVFAAAATVKRRAGLD